MPSSSPTRAPSCAASATQSSIVTPASGMNGQTSVAPMRGCSPSCAVRSMRSRAVAMPRNAASTASAGGATNVTTMRLWLGSDDTSSTETPSTDGDGVADRGDHLRTTPLGEVRHALHKLHARERTPRAPQDADVVTEGDLRC